MGFEGGVSDLVFSKTSRQHPSKFQSAADEADKIKWTLRDVEDNPVAFDGRIRRGETVYSLAQNEFYSTRPGIYSFDFESVVDDVLVAKQSQQLRIVDTFRRYLVPHTHCVVDINKPVDVDVIHVVVGEPIEFLVLHPLLGSENSDVGIEVNVVGGIGNYTLVETRVGGFGTPTYKVSLTFNVANASGYDVEFNFMPYDTAYRMLSLIPAAFRVRVYSTPLLITSTPAVLSDSQLAQLYRGIVFLGGFTATVRTVGLVGTLSGDLNDGEQVEASGSQVIHLTYQLQETLQLAEAAPLDPDTGTAPSTSLIDLELLLQDILVHDLSPQGLFGKSVYLGEGTRYVFHSIPLPIDPGDILTVSGYASVVPYYFYVEDTQDPSVGAYPNVLELGFESTIEGMRVATPTGVGGSYVASLSYRYAAGGLLTNTVHKVLLSMPANGGRNDWLQVDRYRLYRFSTQYANLSTMTWDQVRRWVALGNFVHELFGVYNEGATYFRANLVANELNRLYLASSDPCNIKEYWTSGIGACGSVALAATYLIGAAGFNEALGDDGVASNFSPLLMASNDFAGDTNNGQEFGFHFGLCTQWLTEPEPQFIVPPTSIAFCVLFGGNPNLGHAICTLQVSPSLAVAIDSNGITTGSTVQNAVLNTLVAKDFQLTDIEAIGLGVGINKRALFSWGQSAGLIQWNYPGTMPSTTLIPSYDPDTGNIVLRDADYAIVDVIIDPEDVMADAAHEYADGYASLFGGYQGYFYSMNAFGMIIYRGTGVPAGGYMDAWFNAVCTPENGFDISLY